MNVDEKDTAAGADLELTLGNSNQIPETLNDDLSAGANAGLQIDMTFVDTNPMSELVWSPQKGLSLKCANGCIPAKRSSVLWREGPRKRVKQLSTDKPVIRETFLTSLTACNTSSEVSGKSWFPTYKLGKVPLTGTSNEFKNATDEQVDPVRTAVAMSASLKEEDLRENESEVSCKPLNFQVDGITETKKYRSPSSSVKADKVELDFLHNEPNPEKPTMRTTDIDSKNRRVHPEVVSASEVQYLKQFEGHDFETQKVTSVGEGHEKLSSLFEGENKNKTQTPLFVRPLFKLESTAENDLPTPVSETACDAMKIVASKPAHNVDKSPLQDEVLPKDTTIEENESPTSSKIRRYRKKGKAKALSDGHVNEEPGNEEDDSHESVESCNSAGLLSTGRKWLNFEQQLIMGSKRVKTQIQDSADSSAVVKRNSSFMNWISNMMKGLSKSNEDESPCLALSLVNPCRGSNNHRQSPNSGERKQYSSGTMGFQSVFKALYRPKTETNKSATLMASDEPDGSKDDELDIKKCDINATPIACRTGPDCIYWQFLPSNENLECSTTNEARLMARPKDISMTIAANKEINGSSSMENKSSKEKDGASVDSSLGKCKTKSVENFDSEPSAGGKRNDGFCSSSGLLSSMWITRFTRKSFDHLLEVSDKGAGEVAECSPHGLGLESPLQNPLGAFIGHKLLDTKEKTTEEPVHAQNGASSSDTSFGFYKMKNQHYEKFVPESQPLVSLSKRNKSEAMASVFARRLDALKHIMQSDVTHVAAHENTTCFFCGKTGHYLRDCSKITDNELEELLRNVTLYNGPERLTCICIRCLQLNHWAVACPNRSLRTNFQAECGTLLVNEGGHRKMDVNERNDEIPKMSIDENNLEKEDPHNSDRKLSEATSSGNKTANLRLFDNDVPTSSKLSFKENKISPPYGFVDRHILDVPYRVFNALNSLRLSRIDILKWMNSQKPVSCLDGFFLRLRLGKWEKGLGGTGYHVACITGSQRKNSPRQSRNSIFVNVGGMRCSVESKYISNHDFQKDELMAWWSANMKDGGKIPSEEDLKQKMKEKRMLGW